MNRLPLLATLAAAILGTSGPTNAAPVLFNVDPALSSLSITSDVSLFNTHIATSDPQGDNALTVSYSGKIVADVTPTTIQFLSTSSLTAGNSGNWTPGSNYDDYTGVDDQYDGINDGIFADGYVEVAEPANYGLLTDLSALGPAVIGQRPISSSAIRNVAFSIADSAPKSLVGGVFDEANTDFNFTAGTVYYASGGPPPITDLLLGPDWIHMQPTAATSASGTLVKSPGLWTLTTPVEFEVSYIVNFLTITTTFAGTIVATAVPEPSSLMLLGCSALGLVALRRRSRNS